MGKGTSSKIHLNIFGFLRLSRKVYVRLEENRPLLMTATMQSHINKVKYCTYKVKVLHFTILGYIFVKDFYIIQLDFADFFYNK